MERVSIRVGDINTMEVDAIENTTNSTLLGGSGVDELASNSRIWCREHYIKGTVQVREQNLLRDCQI